MSEPTPEPEMKTYLVLIPEVHYSHRRIKAVSPEDARERAGHEGDEIYLEYSHTLDDESDNSQWECREEKSNG